METIQDYTRGSESENGVCEHEEIPAARLLRQYVVDGKLVAEWIKIEDIINNT